MKKISCLGIETSCDETAVAIVTNDSDPFKRILFNRVFSQDHRAYGGVVPELASRAHIEQLAAMVKEALVFDFDLIAATTAPGLMGGLLVGSSLAKTLARAKQKTFIPINHLIAHALTPRLTHNVAYPYLLLLVSGGHCQIRAVVSVTEHHLLEQTRDDAVGEAFDKVAQMLGLPYPGGPSIEKYANNGDHQRFSLPRPLFKEAGLSFSGLKTAVRLLIEKEGHTDQDRYDIAASFQKTACDTLLRSFQKYLTPFQRCVMAGGVASNSYLRNIMQEICTKEGKDLFIPPVSLCTDNAAMVAWTGIEIFENTQRTREAF